MFPTERCSFSHHARIYSLMHRKPERPGQFLKNRSKTFFLNRHLPHSHKKKERERYHFQVPMRQKSTLKKSSVVPPAHHSILRLSRLSCGSLGMVEPTIGLLGPVWQTLGDCQLGDVPSHFLPHTHTQSPRTRLYGMTNSTGCIFIAWGRGGWPRLSYRPTVKTSDKMRMMERLEFRHEEMYIWWWLLRSWRWKWKVQAE